MQKCAAGLLHCGLKPYKALCVTTTKDTTMDDEQDDPTSEENRADDHWSEHGDWFAIAAEITGAPR